MPTEPSEVEGALPQGRRSHSYEAVLQEADICGPNRVVPVTLCIYNEAVIEDHESTMDAANCVIRDDLRETQSLLLHPCTLDPESDY